MFYVPDFQFNLLSVGHLNHLGYAVTFKRPTCYLTNEDGNTCVIGTYIDGLFVCPLNIMHEEATLSVLAVKPINHAQLIHQRFGHITDTYLYTAASRGLVTGLLLPSRPSRFVYPFCDPCALAKAIRISSRFTPGSRHRITTKTHTAAISTASTQSSPLTNVEHPTYIEHPIQIMKKYVHLLLFLVHLFLFLVQNIFTLGYKAQCGNYLSFGIFKIGSELGKL